MPRRGFEEIDSGEMDIPHKTDRRTRASYERAGVSKTTRAAKDATAKQRNDKNIPRGAARRKITPQQRILKTLREIKKFQKSTKLLIPRMPFGRVVREISLEINPCITRYTATALEALQEATEMFIVQVLQDSYLLTMHRKCVTLTKADMMLIRALKINI